MKKLKEILFKVNIDSVYGDTDIDITKITFDSRNVESNTLFIAIKGHNINGHDYIEESIKNGASVIICEKLPENFKRMQQFRAHYTSSSNHRRKKCAYFWCNNSHGWEWKQKGKLFSH